MRLKKLICPFVTLLLAVGNFAGTAFAAEVQHPIQTVAVSRASGRLIVDVPTKTVNIASYRFPLEVGETVTIKAS